MMRWLALAIVLALVSPAAAERITVTVTEVAGGIAYVTPGAAAGLVHGTKVTIRGRAFLVLEATDKTASLALDKGNLSAGDTGAADVDRATVSAGKLPPPRPLDTFKDQWPAPALPAESQSPASVPLGAAHASQRARVTVIGHAFGTTGSRGRAGNAEARVIGSYDLWQDHPLAADGDLALQLFSDGYSKQARSPLFLRTAQLRWGAENDPRFALGRLRWAASTVGMLDGARASAQIGRGEVAAFGGLVPDPLTGKPNTGVARFGTELAFDDVEADWQPRLALTAVGSTWAGQLDERRLALVGSIHRDAVWLDGWAEAQQFPANNPWNARVVELTGAGATAHWRKRGRHVGLDLTFLRPDRSLRLASAIPSDWVCTRVAQIGDVPNEVCGRDDYWTAATASAGVRNPLGSIDAVGSFGRSHGAYVGFDGSGFVRGEVFTPIVRLIASGSGGHASFVDWVGGEAGLGMPRLVDPPRWLRFDASVRYRVEVINYDASMGLSRQSSIFFDARVPARADLDLALFVMRTTGADHDATAVLTTAVWRPAFP